MGVEAIRHRPIRRVLLFCPVYELYARTLESIFRLRWDGALDRFFAEDNPFPTHGRYNINHNYQKARRLAIDGDYDALLTFESDIIAPEDGLKKLAAHIGEGIGVARGLYCLRRGNIRWSAQMEDGVSVSHTPRVARGWWGTVQETAGIGLGFTLIARDVLESLDWHHSERVGADGQLVEHCRDKDVGQVCDLSVVCGHIKREPSVVLWPDVDGEDLYRIEVL
jgi:hypothetical protein